MATNIIEAVQMNLGYSALQKIDPNSQDTRKHQDYASSERLGQAAIPAVLTALFKFTRTEENCRILLDNSERYDWLSVIYGGKEAEAVDKVAHYSGVDKETAEDQMKRVAVEAVKIVKQEIKNHPTPEKIKTYMNGQRHNILVYLPASLNMGDVLNDETIDDKTNKMEGPISTFMHRIEDTLSDGDEKKGIF